MSSPVLPYGRGRIISPSRSIPSAISAETHERSVRRRVAIAWGLLVINALGYTGALVHVPSAFGKAITQGALPLAIIVALTVNRRIMVRPNVFLCLVSLLVLEAFVPSLTPQHFGTVYRTFRLLEFVVALWLLTPWWGRRDLLLVRCHLTALSVILGSVLLGVLVAPGRALGSGRLSGVLWDIPPTQVAHYAAVVTGVVIVLWLCGHMRGRVALVILALTVAILILTHTRTALVGMTAGLLVSGMSLLVAKARVRKLFAGLSVITALAIMTLSSVIVTWLARGEGTQELTNLTGRTVVWSSVVNFPRDKFQEIFGFGLSNDSFNGLPIDSNWLATYHEQGLLGIGLCAIILIFMLVAAYFQPRGVQRALALFFITYCLVASFTETGLAGATTYLLELTLAASLIVSTPAAGRLR